jgi:hypothetical protein
MSETRDFPTAVVASLSTGVLLCDGGFSEMHEAAEFLMGHSIWTHHFASKELWADMQRSLLEQCPGLPTDGTSITADNYRSKLDEIEAEVGKTVCIRKGSGLTAMLPTDGIPDNLKDNIIIMASE